MLPRISTLRIAVASTPLTATLAEAVPAVIAAIEAAGKSGARILCLPEAILPGHRMQKRPVEEVSSAATKRSAFGRKVSKQSRNVGSPAK